MSTGPEHRVAANVGITTRSVADALLGVLPAWMAGKHVIGDRLCQAAPAAALC